MCGAPLDDWSNGGSVDVFFTYGMVIVLWGVGRILGMGMEFRDRIMLNCFREPKCQQQSYTLGI